MDFTTFKERTQLTSSSNTFSLSFIALGYGYLDRSHIAYHMEIAKTQPFREFLLKGYFPAQWKIAQIILILKPGKRPKELASPRRISLLPIVSRIFENSS
jgi:hypothetical protein